MSGPVEVATGQGPGTSSSVYRPSGALPLRNSSSAISRHVHSVNNRLVLFYWFADQRTSRPLRPEMTILLSVGLSPHRALL